MKCCICDLSVGVYRLTHTMNDLRVRGERIGFKVPDGDIVHPSCINVLHTRIIKKEAKRHVKT